MELIDHLPWRNTNSTNEQLRLLLNHNVNELMKLALRVVVLECAQD